MRLRSAVGALRLSAGEMANTGARKVRHLRVECGLLGSPTWWCYLRIVASWILFPLRLGIDHGVRDNARSAAGVEARLDHCNEGECDSRQGSWVLGGVHSPFKLTAPLESHQITVCLRVLKKVCGHVKTFWNQSM